jgi:hypothetical protein
MSSETTELTFVRCPSCRSLVPATATRCRICNNPLEGGGKAEESDASKAASRIRQRTISASADEVASALSEMNGDSMPEPAAPAPPTPAAQPAPAARPPAPPAEDEIDFDPLGAYLQELEEAEELGLSETPAPKDAPLGASAPSAAEEAEELDPFDLDIFGEPDDEPTSAPVAPAPVQERAEEPVRPAVVAPPQPTVQADASREPVRAPERVESPRSKEQQEPRRPFGMPAQGGRSAAAPEAGRAERQVEHRPQEQRQRDDRGQDQRRPKDSPPPRPNNQHNQQQPKRDARGEQRHDAQRGNKSGQDYRPETQGGGRPSERGPGGAPRPAKINPGRLFGWLVSYENPDGRAIELREGKFFVTGNSIKATDLVIEDASISTPHALMSVSGEGGFKVQDLMSERGLFVRSREGGQYRREEGTVEIKHGDWLRFGDVEFLVTIVPTGSGR